MSTGATESDQGSVSTVHEEAIVAEVCLDHPGLVLRPTMSRFPDLRMEPSYGTTDGELEYLAISVTGTPGSGFHEREAFECALAEDETVEDPLLIDQDGDRCVYRVTISPTALRFLPEVTALGGHVLRTTSSRQGWTVRVRLPDRDALVAFNEFCAERDVRLHVNALRVASDVDDVVVGLTPKQQELLYVAYSEGYFDVPRRISQNELADRLGVSKSAISQRLRRSIDQLLQTTFTEGGEGD